MPEDFLYRFLMFYPAFLFALTVHEVAHALTANWGGDLTATYEDRLSLNPAVHIDPIGTVLFPILMLTGPGFFLFGWAKPVPVQEARFTDKTWNVVVALAGPFSNVLLAIFGTLVLSLGLRIGLAGDQAGWWTLSDNFMQTYSQFTYGFVSLNWLLCLFNLIPVPPLDGSHVLYHFFIRGRGHLYGIWETYRRFGFLFLLIAFIALSSVGGILGAGVYGLTILTLSFLGYPAYF